LRIRAPPRSSREFTVFSTVFGQERRKTVSAHLEAMVPIEVAAERFGYQVSLLQHWIDVGKIRAVMLNNSILVSEAALMADLPKEERPEFRKFAHLRGKGIGLREAGRKYSINSMTLSEWVKRGYIQKIGMQGAQKMLLDEADVAYASEIYHTNPGQGKRIFNPDGTPYRTKS
jgi:hypothetical protein